MAHAFPRPLEVIRKKQLLLLRNRPLGKRSMPLTLFDAVSGNRRQLRRIHGEGGGGDETGGGEHGG